MDSAEVTVGTHLFFFLPPFFIEYCDPRNYLEDCHINGVLHLYMNNHIITQHKLSAFFVPNE